MSKLFKTLERTKAERTLREAERTLREAGQTLDTSQAPDMSETFAPNGHDPLQPASPRSQRVDVTPDHLDPHLVTFLHPSTFAAEQYRALGHQLEQLRAHAGLHVMAISSPMAGDGKTTTVLNLAGVLAQTPELRVLLIEMDLHRPAIGEEPRLASSGLYGLSGRHQGAGFIAAGRRHQM